MSEIININLCDEVETLLDSTRYISNEISGDYGIRENIKYFVRNASSKEDITHIENIIKGIGNINKKLDNILDVAKTLMDIQADINENNKTYYSKILSEGDDLK